MPARLADHRPLELHFCRDCASTFGDFPETLALAVPSPDDDVAEAELLDCCILCGMFLSADGHADPAPSPAWLALALDPDEDGSDWDPEPRRSVPVS